MSTDYSAGTGNESVIKNTKNEPVVSRNVFHEARFRKGAKQTLGTGQRKLGHLETEMILVDIGG